MRLAKGWEASERGQGEVGEHQVALLCTWRPGSPFRCSTRGLLGRLMEKLVLAANLPPSTTSWDTTLRPLVSGSGKGKG